MSLFNRRTFGGLVLAALALVPAAWAQENYPTRPVTLVVPYNAGGGTDTATRIIAKAMAENLGQNVIVSNKAGGGATIGAKIVAGADPDGYTILIGVAANLITNPALLENVGYDPIEDFSPVSLLSANPMILVASKDAGFSNLGDVIAAAKEQPGVIPVASYGQGTPSHLAIELLQEQAGIELIHVPFGGSAPAQAALLGGHVPLMMDFLPSEVKALEAGQVVGIAIGQMEESEFAVGVGTFAEAGLKDFEALTFFGLVAPAGTPKAVVDRLNEAVQFAMNDAEVKAALSKQGFATSANSPADFAIFIERETNRWAPILAKQ